MNIVPSDFLWKCDSYRKQSPKGHILKIKTKFFLQKSAVQPKSEVKRLGIDPGRFVIYKNRKGNNKKMKLKDTVDLMCSEYYENRFLAEYRQTKIRYEKLHRLIIKARAGTLGFKLKCSVELLEAQAAAMGQYLKILEIRAEKEGIEVLDLM